MFYFLLCAIVVTIVSMKSFASAAVEDHVVVNNKRNLTYDLFNAALSRAAQKHIDQHGVNPVGLAFQQANDIFETLFYPENVHELPLGIGAKLSGAKQEFVDSYDSFFIRFHADTPVGFPLLTQFLFNILDVNNDETLTYNEILCDYKQLYKDDVQLDNAIFGDGWFGNYLKKYIPDEKKNKTENAFRSGALLAECVRNQLKDRYGKNSKLYGNATLSGDLITAFKNPDKKDKAITPEDFTRNALSVASHIAAYLQNAAQFQMEEFGVNFAAFLNRTLNDVTTSSRNMRRPSIVSKRELEVFTQPLFNDLQAMFDGLNRNVNSNKPNDMWLTELRLKLTVSLYFLDETEDDFFENYDRVEDFTNNVKPILNGLEDVIFELLDQEGDGDVDEADINKWVLFLTNDRKNERVDADKSWEKLKSLDEKLKGNVDPRLIKLVKDIFKVYSLLRSKDGRDAALDNFSKRMGDLSQLMFIWKHEYYGGAIDIITKEEVDKMICHNTAIPSLRRFSGFICGLKCGKDCGSTELASFYLPEKPEFNEESLTEFNKQLNFWALSEEIHASVDPLPVKIIQGPGILDDQKPECDKKGKNFIEKEGQCVCAAYYSENNGKCEPIPPTPWPAWVWNVLTALASFLAGYLIHSSKTNSSTSNASDQIEKKSHRGSVDASDNQASQLANERSENEPGASDASTAPSSATKKKLTKSPSRSRPGK